MTSRRVTSEIHPGLFVWLLITLGINVLALIVINWLFDSVWIQGFWSYALGALALTIGNAIIKPILALLTLPLIIFTLGLAYFAINVAMLALAEWVAPRFSIDGFWTYVGVVVIIWIVNWAGWRLIDEVETKRPASRVV
jgi:putative membrane protein